MVTVEVDSVRVESRLAAGRIGCPTCRGGVLGGWGYAPVPLSAEQQRTSPKFFETLDCGDFTAMASLSPLLAGWY